MDRNMLERGFNWAIIGYRGSFVSKITVVEMGPDHNEAP